MRGPQFTLRALLLAMLVVAAFFGGMAVQRYLDKPNRGITAVEHGFGQTIIKEAMTMRDGSEWERRTVVKHEPWRGE